MIINFWKGVEASIEYDFIAASPFLYRSPLDIANDMRGNDLFFDMVDNPEAVDVLINYSADSIITLDKYLRQECPIIDKLPGGAWGSVFGDNKTIILNADPIDLISNEMAIRFNKASIEKIIDYIDALYLHHHSIGYRKEGLISEFRGLMLQEILQDPNGSNLVDVIDDLIPASKITPIHIDVDLLKYNDHSKIMENLSDGRFIVSILAESSEDIADIIDRLKQPF